MKYYVLAYQMNSSKKLECVNFVGVFDLNTAKKHFSNFMKTYHCVVLLREKPSSYDVISIYKTFQNPTFVKSISEDIKHAKFIMGV